jgi:hypothetical protein
MDNLTDSVENASNFVTSPSFDPMSMDFYPLPGRCQGEPLDLSTFHTEADYTLDFNGAQKTIATRSVSFRGAYAGEGTNRGWHLQAATKPPHPPVPPSLKSFAPLIWIAPSTVTAGSTVTVSLFGANFRPDASLSVSGVGISVSDLAFDSPTEIIAKLRILPAVSGKREITLDNSGTRSNPIVLTVARGRTTPKAP